MKKNMFSNFGFEVSKLGFGCMRMPIKNPSSGDFSKDIDYDECIKMVRYAIDNGINYIDTAYVYHDGESEKMLGVALKDGYRDKVKIATKMPSWCITNESDMYRLFDEQLKNLQTDCVDFYLLHALNEERFEFFKRCNYKKFFDKMMKEGRIKYPAFSFHDTYDSFEKIINDYDFKWCKYNLIILI